MGQDPRMVDAKEIQVRVHKDACRGCGTMHGTSGTGRCPMCWKSLLTEFYKAVVDSYADLDNELFAIDESLNITVKEAIDDKESS